MDQKKTYLLIMRHAESELLNFHGEDFARPLSSHGLNQPIGIATSLNQLPFAIHSAVVSPSLRTMSTWEILKTHLKNDPQCFFDRRLYNADKDRLIDVISDHGHDSIALLLIGHCPAVSQITEYLSGTYLDFNPGTVAILSTDHQNFLTKLSRPHRFTLEQTLTAELSI